MLKITLVYFGNIECYDPKGVLYIGTQLKKSGHDVSLIGVDLEYDKDFKNKFINDIKLYHPDIVGFSVMSLYSDLACQLSTTVKELSPKTKVMFGGAHPTIMPETVLQTSKVDFVVIGEGDVTVVELVDAIEFNKDLLKIKGIAYKNNGTVKFTEPRQFIENLDSLSIDRTLLPINKVIKRIPFFPLPYPQLDISAGRGCAFNCSFCQPTVSKIFGKKERKRSPENVIAEIKELKNKYKIKSVSFSDDTFTTNYVWAERLCDLMIKEKLKVSWYANGRINRVNKELLVKMKKAGCIGLVLAIESGSERVRNEILNKKISQEQIITAFKLCREVGILTQANIMIGNPTETVEDLKASINIIKKVHPDFTNNSYTTILPGTALWDIYINNDNFKDWSALHLGVPKSLTRNLSTGQMKDAFNFIATYNRFGKRSSINFLKSGPYRVAVLKRWLSMISNPIMLLKDIYMFVGIQRSMFHKHFCHLVRQPTNIEDITFN